MRGKQLGKGVLCILLIAGLAACTTAQKQIALRQNSTATEVFEEVQDQVPPAKNVTDLLIKASIKTPVFGHHLFESETHRHGKPGYPFVFNVDGQGIMWKVDDGYEGPSPDAENQAKGPETGEGFRYLLAKRIRLAPGSHTIFLGLPDEDYFTQNTIDIGIDRVNVLEYRPVYRKTGRGIASHFLHGIKAYELYLNGTRIDKQ